MGSSLRRVGAGFAVLALAACGGATHRPPAESSGCRVLASAAADDARELLRDYGGNPSPADLPFYDLRETLANVQVRCRPEWLGAALQRSLTDEQTATLLSLLPATYVTYLRLALGCARGSERAGSCARAVRSIHSPGAAGTGATPHPVVP